MAISLQARSKWRLGTVALTLALALGVPGAVIRLNAVRAAAKTSPVQGPDAALDAVSSLVGRAIFLRGCYAGGDLTFDALGQVKGEPKKLDWTLSGANIERISRRGGGTGAGELELDGVRVAMRYNPDQHIFERHPLKEEKLRILLAVNADARGLQGALATMFAVGIDPALQRAMPSYWRHYFSPGLAWPNDDLTGQSVIPANFRPGEGVEAPVLEKKLEPEFTNEAREDHVKGTVQLRMTVGTDGIPRRIAIRQPLGYGLDERAVETAARYRFHPGLKDGKPVAVEMIVNQGFDYYPTPGR
jgi:TonB family protein